MDHSFRLALVAVAAAAGVDWAADLDARRNAAVAAAGSDAGGRKRPTHD